MSPRPYNLGKRRETIDQSREQVLAAARSLLAEPGGPAFTVDAVARRADVGRGTVYYQVGSKARLLEDGRDGLTGPGGVAGALPRSVGRRPAPHPPAAGPGRARPGGGRGGGRPRRAPPPRPGRA